MVRRIDNSNVGSLSDIVITILAVMVMVVSSFATFSFNITYAYWVLFGTISIAVMMYPKISLKLKHRLLLIFLYSIILWIMQSFLIRYRGSQLHAFAPTSLANMFNGVLMGFFFVFYPIKKRLLKALMYADLVLFLMIVVVNKSSFDMLSLSETASGVSILTLSLSYVIPVLYLDYRDENKICIFPLLLQMAVALFIDSRTGLGTSALLLVFALLIGVLSSRKNSERILTALALGAVFIAAIYMVFINVSDFGSVSRTLEYGTDLTGRGNIWDVYFYDFTLQDIIYGRNIIGFNEGPWQNAHNSFIQLHSSVGIIGVIIMLIGIRVFLFYLKRELFFSLVMACLFFFAFFNAVFFFYVHDWCVYIFFFEFLRVRGMNKLHKRQIKVSIL